MKHIKIDIDTINIVLEVIASDTLKAKIVCYKDEEVIYEENFDQWLTTNTIGDTYTFNTIVDGKLKITLV